MKATLISKENSVADFTMEFTGKEFEEAVEKVYKKNKHKFIVDGFRKGKAPRSIIEKRYGNSVFEDDAINEMFSDNYLDAVKELRLKIIDAPQANFKTINREEGITVEIKVAVYPEVEVKDYIGVEIEKVSDEVTDEDVDEEIKTIQKRNARMQVVDRPVKDGDHILFDFDGSIDGKRFDGGKAERYSLEIGSGQFIPGFEEQLIGVGTDEEKDVKVTFPEDYHAEDLAGKEVVFKCKLHEIKEEELPELNDDFAKDVSEFDTFEEFMADTRNKLAEEKKMKAENRMKDAAVKAVYEANDIDVPKPLVEDEIDTMINKFKQQLQQQGMEFDKYLKYIDKKEKDIREDMREEAARNTKTRMLVGAVVEKENIEASDDEIDELIENMAKQYNMEVDHIKEQLGEDNIAFMRNDLEMKKAVDFIFEKAVIK